MLGLHNDWWGQILLSRIQAMFVTVFGIGQLFNVNTSFDSVRVVGWGWSNGVVRNQRRGKSNLIFVQGNLNSQRYIDQILTPVVVPYILNARNITFMDDNAPSNAAPDQQN